MSYGSLGIRAPDDVETVLDLKRKFVAGIMSGEFASELCQRYGVLPSVYRAWRSGDPEFREAVEDAESAITDSLERAAITRARDGVLEPVVAAGRLVMGEDGEPLMVRKYSDSLLQFLLRGRRRDTYGDRREVDSKLTIDVVGSRAALEAKFLSVLGDEESSGGQ